MYVCVGVAGVGGVGGGGWGGKGGEAIFSLHIVWIQYGCLAKLPFKS